MKLIVHIILLLLFVRLLYLTLVHQTPLGNNFIEWTRSPDKVNINLYEIQPGDIFLAKYNKNCIWSFDHVSICVDKDTLLECYNNKNRKGVYMMPWTIVKSEVRAGTKYHVRRLKSPLNANQQKALLEAALTEKNVRFEDIYLAHMILRRYCTFFHNFVLNLGLPIRGSWCSAITINLINTFSTKRYDPMFETPPVFSSLSCCDFLSDIYSKDIKLVSTR